MAQQDSDQLRKEFNYLYDSYSRLIDHIAAISKQTGFQAVIYDEQENFQSFEILENFNYPFANRKQVKNEYYALVPTNSTTKQIETHKLYF